MGMGWLWVSAPLAFLLIWLLIYHRRVKKRLKVDVEMARRDAREARKEVDRLVDQQLREMQELVVETTNQISHLMSSRFHLKFKETRVKFSILNAEGDLELDRTHEGLQTGRGLSIHYMDHLVSCIAPQKEILDPVLDMERSSQGTTLEITDRQSSIVRFRVSFSNERHSEEIHYRYKCHISRGALMWQEEIQENYKGSDISERESFEHRNQDATDKLHLEVNFPWNYPARNFNLRVLVDNGDKPAALHKLETVKYANALVQTETGVALDINKPIQGFTYYIDWESPTKEEFELWKKKLAAASAIHR